MSKRKSRIMVAVGTRGKGNSYAVGGKSLPLRKNTLAQILGIQTHERIVACILGDRATGKTESAKKIIKKYKKKKERVLIVDSNDEYLKYDKIKPKQIATFKGVKRIVGSDTLDMDGIMSFKDGLIVFEAQFHSSLDYIITVLSTSNKSRCIDVVVVGNTPAGTPRLLASANCIELHQSNQLLSKKLPHDAIVIAEYYIEGDDRYRSIIVDLRNFKFVKGSYSESSLMYATKVFAFEVLAQRVYEKYTT